MPTASCWACSPTVTCAARWTTAGVDMRSTRIVEVMTRTPKTIGSDALAVEAAQLMETHKIGGLLVVDAEHRVVGALNIHDLLRARVV